MKRVTGVVVAVVMACAGTTAMAADGALPGGWASNSAVFRGPSGNGYYPGAKAVTEWSEADNANILWKAKVILGWASPIVWGDKVIVTGATAGQRMVYCFDAATGNEAWKLEVPAVEGATEEYTLDTMDQRWDTLLHAGATPATNGKQVFAAFSNGQLAAIDLASGKHLWSVALGDTSGNTYGLDNSLLVYGNSVIAVFQGDLSYVAAFDAASGKELWKTERESSTWASPVLVRTKSGKTLVVLTADPDVTAWDATTGEKVWSAEVLTGGPEYCVGPSAVAVGDIVAVNCQNCGIFGLNAETGEQLWGLEELPDGSGFPDGASMATDGKLLYQYFESVLTIVDAKSGKVIAQKETDEFASYGSPAVIGANLYLVAGSDFVVMKTGKTGEVVGNGVLDESSDSCMAAADGRIFIRTDEAVYCIGN